MNFRATFRLSRLPALPHNLAQLSQDISCRPNYVSQHNSVEECGQHPAANACTRICFCTSLACASLTHAEQAISAKLEQHRTRSGRMLAKIGRRSTKPGVMSTAICPMFAKTGPDSEPRRPKLLQIGESGCIGADTCELVRNISLK